MCNVCMCRTVREVLVKDVNTPPTPTPLMTRRQHVQHVKDTKRSNPIPPFRKASFLKFATLPRDRKWHISKLATLPRAPYQPHAENNCGSHANQTTVRWSYTMPMDFDSHHVGRLPYEADGCQLFTNCFAFGSLPYFR